MNKTLITVGIIVAIILVIFLWIRGFNNSMVTKNENTAKMWSNVESQYQRRIDLFSNVVNTIKGSADFEKSTLEAVIEARSQATKITVDPTKLTPESIAQFQQAQNSLNSSFSKLLLVVEQYPVLKTTDAFRDFQVQIEGTENRINKARDDFNATIQDYNTYIKLFPNSLFAGMFGYSEKGYFKAAAGSENAPNVDFNEKSPEVKQ